MLGQVSPRRHWSIVTLRLVELLIERDGRELLVNAKVGGGCNVRAVRHFLAAGAVVLVVALLPGMGSTATGAATAPPTSYYIALGASLSRDQGRPEVPTT